MNCLESVAVSDLTRALTVFRDLLKSHRVAIDELNVYPVPDGDTGTNMSLTLESVVAEVEAAPADAASQWKAISHGSLMGARGNSGVILSQVLRGLADHLSAVPADDAIGSLALAGALRAASIAADAAVMRPVEGTILTVVRDTSAAATVAAEQGADLATMLEASLAAGRRSLERTPDLLPVLAAAGVVDAGGAGFLLMIDALLHVVSGRPLPAPPETGSDGTVLAAVLDVGEAGGVADLRYEVMFFLDAPDGAIDSFKSAWMDIGDSIVVVGGEGLWNCHIHSNDIGACIEAGIAVGRPHKIRVTDLFEEVEHREEMAAHHDDSATVQITNPAPATTAVVAVAVGDGVQRIFESLGVHAVIRGGQSMNPSTRQIVQAVQQVDADQVVVLPNNKNIVAVANRVDDEVDKLVVVVPTTSIAEGFAALLAYDPGAPAAANQQAMADAAAAVFAGEVTCAVRDAETDAGPVSIGDWLGLDRTGVVTVAATMIEAATGLARTLLSHGGELLTIISGADATPQSDEAITAWLALHHPEVEVEIHDGGQPLYPYLLGVE